MSKKKVRTNAPLVGCLLESADGTWLAAEIKTLNKGASKAGKTKASARAFLQRHGFVTKEGKLTKAYKG